MSAFQAASSADSPTYHTATCCQTACGNEGNCTRIVTVAEWLDSTRLNIRACRARALEVEVVVRAKPLSSEASTFAWHQLHLRHQPLPRCVYNERTISSREDHSRDYCSDTKGILQASGHHDLPTNTPVAASMLATAVLLLLHVPSGVASASVIDTLGQIVDIPVMADGGGVTVIAWVAIQVEPGML